MIIVIFLWYWLRRNNEKQIPIKITAFIILIICSVVGYAGLFKIMGNLPLLRVFSGNLTMILLLLKETGIT